MTWAQLDARSRLLLGALAFSVLLHGVVLSIRFQMPDAKRDSLAPLEVVIVNSKSRTRPEQAQVLAQANLNGGGDTEDAHRVRAPLPNQARNRAGDDLQDARRRVQELEQRQRQLLSQAQAPVTAPASSAPAALPPQPAPMALPVHTPPPVGSVPADDAAYPTQGTGTDDDY